MTTPNGDNWVGELALKRRCQNSNVYIVETLDPKRIQELRERLKSGAVDRLVFGEKTREAFDEKIEYDLQSLGGRPVLWDISKEEPREISSDASGALQTIDGRMRTMKVFVMMRYVVQQIHADQLTEHIIGWSQDPQLLSLIHI